MWKLDLSSVKAAEDRENCEERSPVVDAEGMLEVKDAVGRPILVLHLAESLSGASTMVTLALDSYLIYLID